MKTVIASLVLGLASTAALAAPQYYDPYDRDDRYDQSDRSDRYDRSDRDSRYRTGGYYADRCDRCGRVVSIQRYGYRDRGHNSNGTGGAIVGALVGGALGNQVGKGDGRKAATIAGAVAGGIAGNRIQKNRGRNGNGNGEFEVLVQMDDGRRVVVAQRDLNGIRQGDRVLIRNGRARLL